jgi:uncharacterized repeat protein (TIGR02543 family)
MKKILSMLLVLGIMVLIANSSITVIDATTNFEESTTISTTSDSVKDIVTADLDNDGDQDILAAVRNENSIEYYLNNGDGTFTEQTPLTTTAEGVYSVTTADLDNDGDLDVLSASVNDSTIDWFMNNGDGTFTEQTPVSSTFEQAYSVETADVDNDGDLDVIAVSFGVAGVAWFMNNGDSTFTEQGIIITSLKRLTCVFPGDFDNDGNIDILASGSDSNSVTWYRNDGNGGFVEQELLSTSAMSVQSVFAADLDNDGDLDVLSAHGNESKVAWYENDGTGSFTERTPVSLNTKYAYSVYAADLDEDGDMDVLSASVGDNKIAWHSNNGDGTFTEQEPLSTNEAGASTVYAADLDNDGDLDTVSGCIFGDKISWFENKLNESDPIITFDTNGGPSVEGYTLSETDVAIISFTEQKVSTTELDLPNSVDSADFDNDGHLDIVVTLKFAGEVLWYKNDGTGVFTKQTPISTTVEQPSTVTTADFDNDGDIDIVVGNSRTDTISLYMNNGDGSFVEKTPISLTADYIYFIHAADIDSDGNIDVLSSNVGCNTIAWYKNNGDGTFTEQQAVSTTALSPMGLETADLDQDGDLDVLSANSAGNNVAWYKNNGNGTFTEQPLIDADIENPYSVSVADIDNDGDLDVVSNSHKGNIISWYKNVGNETFEIQPLISSTSEGVYVAETIDINKDGAIDIIAANYFGDDIINYLGNGDGTFTEQPPISTTSDGVSSLTFDDFDHDGDIDIAGSNIGGDSVTWYKNSYTKSQYSLSQPEEQVRKGYTFLGWYKDPSYTQKFNFEEKIDSDTTVYAQWQLDPYTITFDSNTGSGTMSSISTGYGVDEILKPNTYIKEGHSFISWNTKADGSGKTYKDQTTFILNEENDVTLYAQWYTKTYILEFLNYNDSAVKKMYIKFGSDLSAVIPPNDPIRTGYTFTGWDKEIPETMVSETFQIRPLFDVNQYTVEYVDYDGTVLQTQNYDFESELSVITPPTNPQRTGYTFVGWTETIPETMGTDKVVVSAIYKVNQYSIEYIDYDGSVLKTEKYDFGTDLSIVTEPTEPTRLGYTFDTWSDIKPVTMGAKNVTISAMYVVNQYTIEYIDYDGTVLQTGKYYFGSDLSGVTGPINPTRTGYTFTRWNTTVPETMGAEVVTISALYTINQYTIEYIDYNGIVLQTRSYYFGSDLSGVTAPTNPNRTGYTFSTWVGTLPETMGAETVTMTASYNINQYTVEYVDYDGTILQSKNYDYNSSLSEIDIPCNPIRIGHLFDTWVGTVPTVMGTETVTLTASYRINQYAVEYVDYNGVILQTEDFDFESDTTGVSAPKSPTRIGYTFVGWNQTVPETMCAGKIVITALYTINQYIVEYVDNDGTVLQTENRDYKSNLSEITPPSDPSRNGYTFATWIGIVPETMGIENITITATYTVNQYLVEYVDFNGTVLQTSNYDFGSDLSHVTPPTEPTRTGYTFAKWVNEVPDTMGIEKVTIIASYDINQYTVEHVDFDGTILQKIGYDFGTESNKFIGLEEPSRPGYTFAGWVGTVPTTLGIENIKLTASYTINQYTVEYIDYDGTYLQTKNYDFGSDLSGVTAPPNPTRIGYTFAGWSGIIPTTMGNEKITITAVYNVNQYTIEYVDYNGTIFQTKNYDFGSDLSEQFAPIEPNRIGYTFAGWSGTIPATMGTDKVTMTATYMINQYTVEYLDYDGAVIQTSNYYYNSDLSGVTSPNSPTRTGYTFASWSGTIPETMGTDKVTMKATYTINQYTVEYIDFDGTVLQTEEYDFESDLSHVTAPNSPTRIGYTFENWNGPSLTTMGTEKITIKATYAINQYTVEYVDYDGTVLQTKDYYFRADLSGENSPSNPTRIGYRFLGWDQSVPTIMGTEKITIMAMYTINQYTVEYVDYDGTVLQSKSYDYKSDLSGVIAPTIPKRNGYTFESWSGTVPASIGAKNVVIRATYTINQYTVEYVDFNGDVLQTSNYSFGSDLSTVTAPANPTRVGYSFNEWSGTVPEAMGIEKVTIRATYTVNQYTVEYVDFNGDILQSENYDFEMDLSFVTGPENPIRVGYTFKAWDGTMPKTMGTEKVTLTASYDINQYTVDFIGHDGIIYQTQGYDFGSDLSGVKAPPNPARIGYTFAGWNGTIPKTMGTETITITASYVINQYSIEYVDYNGTVLKTTNYYYGSKLNDLLPPSEPLRTGYTFATWSGIIPETMGTETVTIIASYSVNQYKVEYVDYDGTILQEYFFDYESDLSEVIPPIEPSRVGYKFVDWTGVMPATMGIETVTLTATYTINQYTVKYVDYDGNVLQTKNYDYESDLSIVTAPLNPLRIGYTFREWHGEVPETMGTETVIITAMYTINQYTVEYLDYDGTILQTTEYDYESDLSIITAPNNLSRTGYTFSNWIGEVPETMGTEKVSITAAYTINQYIVEYVDYNGDVLQTEKYIYGTDLSTVTAPSNPSRIGYTFREWTGSLPDMMGTETVTITAAYAINEYTVEYIDYNGDVLQTEQRNYESDLNTLTAPSNPSRIGYTFREWTGEVPKTMGTETVTITAKYTINQYTVEYVDQNGIIYQTNDYDFKSNLSGVTAPNEPLRTGYTFAGWNGTIPEIMGTETITIIATYIINQYTIEYVDYDGTVLQTDNYYYDSDLSNVTPPFKPVHEGLKFSGWDRLIPATMGAETITITATYLDDVKPIVSGVKDNQVINEGESVEIEFNEGNATLNGLPYTSGTKITKPGIYKLIVTDEALNSSIMTFEIKDSEILNKTITIIVASSTLIIGSGIVITKKMQLW